MSKSIKKRLEESEVVERPTPLPLRREDEPPIPFPVEVLGPILGDGAEAIVDVVQCPEALAAQSVLAAATLAVQAQVDVVHPALDEPRPVSLFFLTVASSGERKSAADRLALRPIKLRESDLHEAHQLDQRTYRNAKDVHNRAREQILRDKKLETAQTEAKLIQLGPEPCPPLVPLLTVREPTLEGLHKLMAIGEPSLGLFNDEGGTFLGGYGMQDETRLRTGAGLSELWDGSPVKLARGGDGVNSFGVGGSRPI